jgi:hypothetical protein
LCQKRLKLSWIVNECKPLPAKAAGALSAAQRTYSSGDQGVAAQVESKSKV